MTTDDAVTASGAVTANGAATASGADLSERRLSSEVVFAGSVFRAECDRVVLPDGKAARREVVRHPGAAVIAPLPDESTILLVRQFRYALGRHLLELPAGKIDPGETPMNCAARELREETGYDAARWDFMLSVYSSPGFCDERLDLFLARELTPALDASPPADEFVAVVNLPLERALAMADDGAIADAKTVAALFWLRRNLKKI